MTSIKIGEFKGYPTLSIIDHYEKDGQQKEFTLMSFGVRKAKAIESHFADIMQFIRDNDKGEPKQEAKQQPSVKAESKHQTEDDLPF